MGRRVCLYGWSRSRTDINREMGYYEDSNGDPQFAVKTDAGRITVTDELQGRFGGRINAYEKVDGDA